MKLKGIFPADPRTRRFVWDNRTSTRSTIPIIRRSWVTYKVISSLKKFEDDVIISRIKSKKIF